MESLWPLIVTGIVSAVGGVGLWTFLGSVIPALWSRRDAENSRLREDVARLEGKHEKCEQDLVTVKERLAALEQHHASLIPRWIKDARKRVVWVNSRALITIFAPIGLSRDQVEGHTFQELLDMEAAREIDRMDAAALAVPGMAISSLLTLHPYLGKMHIVKIAGAGHDGELIYEGTAYPVTPPGLEHEMQQGRRDEQHGLSMLRLQGPALDDDDSLTAAD